MQTIKYKTIKCEREKEREKLLTSVCCAAFLSLFYAAMAATCRFGYSEYSDHPGSEALSYGM